METKIKNIIEAVAEEYGVSKAEIMGRSREQRIADARMIAMYLVFRNCDYTIVAIGEMFGRNHATICYAIRRSEDLIRFDRPTKRHYENLKKTLNIISHASS